MSEGDEKLRPHFFLVSDNIAFCSTAANNRILKLFTSGICGSVGACCSNENYIGRYSVRQWVIFKTGQGSGAVMECSATAATSK